MNITLTLMTILLLAIAQQYQYSNRNHAEKHNSSKLNQTITTWYHRINAPEPKTETTKANPIVDPKPNTQPQTPQTLNPNPKPLKP